MRFLKKQQEGKERDVLIRHITVKYRVFNIITLSCNFMLVLQADVREIKGKCQEKQNRNQVIIT